MVIVLLVQVYLWPSEPFDLHAVQTILLSPYSNLPHLKNKREKIFLHTLTCRIIVQQILLFFLEKNTYTTLLGPTRLLVYEIFLSKPDFHLYE